MSTSRTHDADSRLCRQTFSSGAYTDLGYDYRSRITSVSHKNSSAGVISSESYVYDSANNLSSKTVDSAARRRWIRLLPRTATTRSTN
ncbi:MAG: hypothetical protein HYR64_05330 [Fimbriimonas ginsengisoli]|uniref:RHS repeat protein n=1 Tax=Fimbriimonas ginsengisoli TaxID=1005039 RepID=A0A931PWC7_FIMGI|nr:hypothetical protein [Fimbriimonas ginsengisoli]